MEILETAFVGIKKMIYILAGISIIFVLFSGCIQENALSEESGDESGNYTIYNYSTPGFEINRTQASEVWEKVRYSDDAKFVTREKNYSVTVFVQRYAKGSDGSSIYGSSTAEWIVVASSIPIDTKDVKIAIFRLDYQTFGFKRMYNFSYPKVKELTREQSIAAMEEEMKKEPSLFQNINEDAVAMHDGNYIFSYHSHNLGGERLLFTWEKDPMQHNGINSFLYSVGFNAITKFEKFDDNGTINAVSYARSASLRLNDEKTRVFLEIDDGSTDELVARIEDGNINIYGTTADTGATIIFNKYAGRTIFHATKAIFSEQTEQQQNVSGRLIIPGEDTQGTLLFNTGTGIKSISSPVYRGTSTTAELSFSAPDYAPNGSDLVLEYITEIRHTDGSIEPEPEGFDIFPEKKRLALERMYLFTWDDIPGKDSVKLIEHLEQIYPKIDWLKTAKIEKIDNYRTIRVFNEANSILLKLNNEKTKIDLRTGIYAPYELFVKTDNNKLHVYAIYGPFEKGNGRLAAYSNLTIKTSNTSVDGDYFITVSARYRGLVVGKNVFSFKIGKGGKKSGGKSMTEGSQNIGHTADNPPPLNATEKAEMAEVVLHDAYLKGRIFKITGVTSEYIDLENYSGFFAVVTVDVGDLDYPGETIRYFIDREEKKIISSSAAPRMALEYFRAKAFDEANGNFTKRWDAWNFPGLWLDNETNITTETLVIDQSLLDSSHRVIEKHNLIYNTYSVPYKFPVFANINVTEVAISNLPFGGRTLDYASIPIEEKKETYQAMGWQGEKQASIGGNRIAKVLLEQNASEVRTLTISESWNMGEGYVLTANSIDAKASVGSPPGQAWFMLSKDGIKLYDIVMTSRRLWIYTPENDTMPLFITYFNKIYSTQSTDEVNFKYTWLRSRNTTEIKAGGIFGIMEVTSIDNGRIELRNRVPINLVPDRVINLMGNMNLKVGSSNTSLSFHPYRVRKP